MKAARALSLLLARCRLQAPLEGYPDLFGLIQAPTACKATAAAAATGGGSRFWSAQSSGMAALDKPAVVLDCGTGFLKMGLAGALV